MVNTFYEKKKRNKLEGKTRNVFQFLALCKIYIKMQQLIFSPWKQDMKALRKNAGYQWEKIYEWKWSQEK